MLDARPKKGARPFPPPYPSCAPGAVPLSCGVVSDGSCPNCEIRSPKCLVQRPGLLFADGPRGGLPIVRPCVLLPFDNVCASREHFVIPSPLFVIAFSYQGRPSIVGMTRFPKYPPLRCLTAALTGQACTHAHGALVWKGCGCGAPCRVLQSSQLVVCCSGVSNQIRFPPFLSTPFPNVQRLSMAS
ncbi:hypothetical protein BC567DRAFT_8370 [Phyllosticta citribraziliensis]